VLRRVNLEYCFVHRLVLKGVASRRGAKREKSMLDLTLLLLLLLLLLLSLCSSLESHLGTYRDTDGVRVQREH
jgi:hypothetical protein